MATFTPHPRSGRGFWDTVKHVNNAPIGIFDSGLGGLTVARAILDRSPGEDTIYLGDTANTPYGPRPLEEVRDIALKNLDYLAGLGVKMLVIACNTATAAAYREAKEKYEDGLGIPVIEVVSPAATVADQVSATHNIGVIGTAGTVASGVYPATIGSLGESQVHQSACPRFVEFVEAGVTEGDELFSVAEEYLAPLKDANVDTVVLGCTHYPLLADVIGDVMGEATTIVSSSHATAEEVARALKREGLEHGPRPEGEEVSHVFLSTNGSQNFEVLSRRFLGPEATTFARVNVDEALAPTNPIGEGD